MVTPQEKAQCVSWFIETKSDEFLKRICFSDEATFYVSGKLNKHHVRIWGSEHPHEIRELERDSPKVNVWRGLMCTRVIGPFFFHEKTITADVYLGLPTENVAPQLIDSQSTIILQQDGAYRIGDYVFVSSSMKHFQTDGLEEMDRFHGHLVHQTLIP